MAKRLGELIQQIAERIPAGTAVPRRAEPEQCPICGGAGWLRMDAHVGDPNFGRLIMCTCLMQEVDERKQMEMREKSNSDGYANLTFENFSAGSSTSVRDAYTAAVGFAEQPNQNWLLLSGSVGTGKTHLAAAVLNASLTRGVDAIIWTVPDLLDYLREAFNPTSVITYDQRFEDIRRIPLLILDDLGTESATPWAKEKLYQLFNHRYNAQLPTVVTTNQDLETIDFRIRSRLQDRSLVRHVKMSAPDFRPRKRAEPTV